MKQLKHTQYQEIITGPIRVMNGLERSKITDTLALLMIALQSVIYVALQITFNLLTLKYGYKKPFFFFSYTGM